MPEQAVQRNIRKRKTYTKGGKMNRKRCIWIAAMTSLLLLSCANLWGQATATSTIQGTVVDKSSAVLSKAEVSITNKDTGATRATKTNEYGEYRFDQVPAGVYIIKINAKRFS